jgi:hypothetical protein
MSKLHKFLWLSEQKKHVVKMVSGDNFSKISPSFAVRTKFRNNPCPATEQSAKVTKKGIESG